MTNVHTLRIIFGHPNLNDALLRCFFDKSRESSVPVRKLWLESCRISAGCDISIPSNSYGLPLQLNFGDLESVRFRRLPLRPGVGLDRGMPIYHSVYARSTHVLELQDGVGGQYLTTTNTLISEQSASENSEGRKELLGNPATLTTLYKNSNHWDDAIYDDLRAYTTREQDQILDRYHVESHEERSKIAYRGPWLDPATLESTIDP